jgi:lysophospholipase L1-like esterase
MRKIISAAIGAALTAMVLVAPTVAQAAPAQQVVRAIGDSYASAYGAGNYAPDTIGTCWRSANSYSEKTAAQLQQMGKLANFVNATCSGATTSDVRQNQLGVIGPDTTLVLLTVGGNDGVFNFSRYSQTCIAADCSGAPTDAFLAGLPNVSGNVYSLLRDIGTAAPHAHIVLVGYGEVLEPRPTVSVPVDPACTQLDANEHRDIHKAEVRLDGALRLAAKVAAWSGLKVTYLSPYLQLLPSPVVRTVYRPHSLCDDSTQWYNGFNVLPPAGDGSLFHANEAWHGTMSGLILQNTGLA